MDNNNQTLLIVSPTLFAQVDLQTYQPSLGVQLVKKLTMPIQIILVKLIPNGGPLLVLQMLNAKLLEMIHSTLLHKLWILLQLQPQLIVPPQQMGIILVHYQLRVMLVATKTYLQFSIVVMVLQLVPLVYHANKRSLYWREKNNFYIKNLNPRKKIIE
jgi:hypothetical protein